VSKPVPTAVSPIAHDATGPKDFTTRSVPIVENAKEMAAKLLYTSPMLLGETLRVLSKAEKAWKVLSPTLKRKDMRQTVPTPDQSDVPSGHDRRLLAPSFCD
jgi:hypothetical protein